MRRCGQPYSSVRACVAIDLLQYAVGLNESARVDEQVSAVSELVLWENR